MVWVSVAMVVLCLLCKAGVVACASTIAQMLALTTFGSSAPQRAHANRGGGQGDEGGSNSAHERQPVGRLDRERRLPDPQAPRDVEAARVEGHPSDEVVVLPDRRIDLHPRADYARTGFRR